MARRMPISRVRSVTDTSMMFMMPMPPTSRLTAATAPSSMVRMRVVPVRVSAIWRVSMTRKLSSSFSAMLRRSRMSSTSCSLAASMEAPSRTATVSRLTSCVPVRRRCTVRSGMTTVSSWSLPMADWPLALSRPTTSQENCLMRMSLPTGFWVPNRLLRTVSPMTHTARPERSSVSLNSRPLTISQLPARK